MSIEAMKLALEALETCNWVDDGGYGHAEYDHVSTNKAITALRQAIEQAQKDPLKTPLPCDVKVGHVNIKKGVALSVLVARMQVLYDMVQEQTQKEKQDGAN